MLFSVPTYGQYQGSVPYAQRNIETTYNLETAKQHITQLQEALQQKGKKKEVEQLYDLVVEDFDRLATVVSMTQIAYDKNVLDTQAAKQEAYWKTIYTEQYDRIYSCLHDGFSTEYAKILEKKIGTTLPEGYTAMSEKAFALSEREQNLIQQYQQAAAKVYTVHVDGVNWNEATLAQSDISDAQYQKVQQALSKEKNKALGNCYLQLVQVRREMAKEAGYTAYETYATDMYGRDYTAEDAKQFCKNVKTYIVPLYETIFKQIEKNRDFQKELASFENNTTQDIMDRVAVVVEGISPELSKIYTYMCRNGLYDFGEPKPERVAGAYTVGMPYYKDAYLFANKENTYSDYQTILHEFGHFASYCYDETPELFRGFSVDVAEIQSQALELLALHEIDNVFGERADTYTLMELSDILFAIMSAAMMYEFEEVVYKQPNMTLDDMNRLFAQIQTQYHATFFPAYENACYDWVDVTHVFDSPMYYIGYGTSAFSALNIWLLSQQDYDAAVQTYFDIVKYASNSSYQNVVEVCDLENVFDAKDVQQMTTAIAKTEAFGGDGVIQKTAGLNWHGLLRVLWNVMSGYRLSAELE